MDDKLLIWACCASETNLDSAAMLLKQRPLELTLDMQFIRDMVRRSVEPAVFVHLATGDTVCIHAKTVASWERKVVDLFAQEVGTTTPDDANTNPALSCHGGLEYLSEVVSLPQRVDRATCHQDQNPFDPRVEP